MGQVLKDGPPRCEYAENELAIRNSLALGTRFPRIVALFARMCMWGRMVHMPCCSPSYVVGRARVFASGRSDQGVTELA